MKQNIKKICATTLATITALSMITGCGSGSTSSSSGKPDPNMVLNIRSTSVEAVSSGRVGSPWYTMSFQASSMFRNLFKASIGALNVEGDLAADYSVSSDGLLYEITLRDDLLWSDGEPIVPEDVVFSIESILAVSTENTIGTIYLTTFSDIVGSSDYLTNFSAGLKGISVDGNTISIALNNPNSLFLQALSQFAILPKHCFEGVNPSSVLSHETYWSNPVCSGMYIQDEAVLGEYISLTYNENYVGDTPYINQIMIRDDFELEDLTFAETNNISEILDFRALSNHTEHVANSVFYRYFVFDIENNGSLSRVGVTKIF